MKEEMKILELMLEGKSDQEKEPFLKKVVGLLENINSEIDQLQMEDQDSSLTNLDGKSYSYAHHLFQNRMQKYMMLRTVIHRAVTQWVESNHADFMGFEARQRKADLS